jgi:hypothetical protein
MDTKTGRQVLAEFEIDDWQQQAEGALGRAFVRKTFRGGLEGTSTAELLMAGGELGRGYIANEVFTGSLAGLTGTIVFQHGGIDNGADPFSYGYVVPGTGTAELVGLSGEISYAHDESGARVTLLVHGLPG